MYSSSQGHQIGITHKMYINTVTFYGDSTILGDVGWGLIAHVYFTAFTAITVQMFYFYRIWVLLNKKNWVVPIALVCASVAQFVIAIFYAVRVSTLTSAELANLTDLISGVNGISAGLDVVIAAIMCWILSTHRTGFKRTDTILFKLVTYVVSSGLLTSICALGTFISFILSSDTFVAYPFNFIISRMYVVSFLATLNSRQGLRSISKEHTEEFDLSLPNAADHSRSVNAPTPPRVLVSIERHEDVYRGSDYRGSERKLDSSSIDDSAMYRK
ncbi:hypothetical protein D9758_017503 [Tetrapyrgos nigripes]|uniref:DUF6534 domain-containing protein n=1 Tax=Tetrapyrgos nigripes TaxID=182062 RepID=A0A8H5B1W0_9AGAR|nr:hypothetical protein D9758_017503 [Tetrapyrgos nigripes]